MLHALAVKKLRDFTLDIDLRFPASVTVLVGPSGAGKTTLLRLIAGLDEVDRGAIALDGRVLDDGKATFIPARLRDIALVFQEYALFPHLTVADNVGYGLRARGVPQHEVRRRVAATLERFTIGECAAVRPGELSGGQRQRAALARGLILQPRALLLDEPLAALDVQTRASVRNELRAIVVGLPIPTIFVTHDPADADAFPERIVAIERGTVTQAAPWVEFRSTPATPFIADFARSGAPAHS